MKVEPLWTRAEIAAIRSRLNDRTEDIRRGYATQQTAARDCLFFTLAVNSGLRASDIIALPSNKQMWAKSKVSLRMQKTGKRVEFSVSDNLRSALDEYWAEHQQPDGYLFYPTNRGRPDYSRHVTVKWANRFFKHWAKLAGLSGDYGSHTARKTLANMIYVTTGRVEDAQALLGHKDPGTTLAYIGVIQRRALQAQADLNL